MGAGASTDRKNLKKAIKSNDVKAVFELLRAGVNVDVPVDPVWEHTPLILATCYGAQGVLPLLLRVSRRKDACNYEGHTALDKSIIYFSLACQFFQQKPEEIEKRFMILKILIEGGCRKVKVPDLELWIRENKRDTKFMANMVEILCLTQSLYLKSVGLATMIRVNAGAFYVRKILESGAGSKYFLKTDFGCHISTTMSDSVAEIMVKASSHHTVHHHIACLKLKRPRQSGKKEASIPTNLVTLLAEVDYPLDVVHSGKHKQLWDDSSEAKSKYHSKDLTRLCRHVIRDSLIPNVLFGTKYLPLPQKLKDYITLDSVSG